jgi:hypothetical protein
LRILPTLKKKQRICPLQYWLFGFCNQKGKCLMCSFDWVFKKRFMFYRQRVYQFKLLYASEERLYFIKKILKPSMFLRIFYICITGSLEFLQRNANFAFTVHSVEHEYGGYWWLYRTFPSNRKGLEQFCNLVYLAEFSVQ